MRVQHLSIDGSVITLESDRADLSQPVSTTGWVLIPALLRSHPVTVRPPGYRQVIEELARHVEGVELGDQDEVNIADGSLRAGVVRVPVQGGGARTMTVGYWEGDNASMSTSIPGREIPRMIEIFESLRIQRSRLGTRLGAPVVATPRPPVVVKAVPRIGVLAIRPAVAAVLEQIPRSSGLPTPHGELFRPRAEARGLLLVSASNVVSFTPDRESASDEILDMLGELRVEWTLRAA